MPSEAAPWRQWGDDIDQAAIDQMRVAAHLPVAVKGALMPDAHVGYGLPIGGVLATDNAVVPSAESLRSASHGAGRVMSRRRAKELFQWAQIRSDLEKAGVTLLSAGIDENPRVYKNIDQVMAQQADLVQPVATFSPRLVKMAPGGRAED